MCGIVGMMNMDGRAIDRSLLAQMTASIRHRGPDDEGFLLVDTRTGAVEPRRGHDSIPELRQKDLLEELPASFAPTLALGWRRLSIIDVSPTGHQPMASSDKAMWIVFNGEIYNYIEIREELQQKGHRFVSKSDTEVILHAYQEWGVECLARFNGMWAFALWDGKRNHLFCARDRFGVKPFYYYRTATIFLFASEIKSLLLHPAISRRANDPIVYDYLVHRLLDHTSQTFFQEIHQLPPGHFLLMNSGGVTIQRYYELAKNPEFGSYEEQTCVRFADGLREHFMNSVRLRLRTDVTLGSCLSGGLDSSSIVCAANQLIRTHDHINRAVIGDHQKTFTASYDDERYNEDNFVKQVIDKTEAEPHVIRPTAQDLWNDLPAFIRALEEPFISTSMYAQWNVMKLAARHGMKVMLDGQGGDELLAGYRWHYPIFHAELLRRGRLSQFTKELSETAAITGDSAMTVMMRAGQKLAKHLLPKGQQQKFLPFMQYMNRNFLSSFSLSNSIVQKEDFDLQARLWQEETLYNLPQLLHYEDRNSMAFSIEARVPFVDYRLVEYVTGIPTVYKIHHGWSKYILRRGMEGILPASIQWRRDKMGFVTPESQWLSVLLPKFRELLLYQSIRSERFIDKKRFTGILASEKLPLPSADVWRLLNLELWMREFQVG
ncbi:MAG: asparagine synthase (glutamine-hydrolyzing) [bacterium]